VNGRRFLPDDWYPEPLPENVVVGERSWIYSSFAFLHHASRRPVAVRIGDDSGIYDGTSFELGPRAEVEIGSFCAIGGAVFATTGRVVIGDYALVSYNVVFADHFAAVPPAARHALGDEREGSGDIIVGENVWIGAGAIVLGGARISDDAIVGAGTIVDGEVPRGATVAGNPAQVRTRAQTRETTAR